jgi:uncharacterized protein (TIGR03437 family)
VSEIIERSSSHYSIFRNVAARFIVGAAGILGCLAFAPQAHAQTVIVEVSTVPNGVQFQVDGQTFSQSQTFAWPAGTQHTLVVASAIQPNPVAPTVYTFQNWTVGPESFPTPSITILANPAVTLYTANFTTTYSFNAIVSSTCGPIPCPGVPGRILVNGVQASTLVPPLPAPYPAGSVETLVAIANAGYAFTHWTQGPNQLITGEQDNVLLNAPTTAVANFVPTVPYALNTAPQGLQLLADTIPTTTPYAAPVGWGTTHSVAAISPQKDSSGNLWVFSSWSDGGAVSHSFVIPNSSTPITLTATFAPAELNTFITSPAGLSLMVDGRTNWNVWSFAWAVGSTHTFSAAATQTDSVGRLWKFTGWSNGGAAAQTVAVGSTGNTYTAIYQQLAQLTVNSTLPALSVSVNGTPCTTPCTLQPPVGTSLAVSAPASIPVSATSRQDLLGWSNGIGSANLTIMAPAAATTLTANYHLMNQLVTASSPAGAATWTMQPGSPDGFYDASTLVNISLSPLPGYQFRNWSGDVNGIAPFGAVMMNQPRTVTALFAKVPYLPENAVTNGAGPTPGTPVAPGSAISIFGDNLSDDVKESLAGVMPQTLDGVTVSANGRLLPLYFVSPGQINAQLPADLPLGPSILTVTTPEQVQLTSNFTLAQDAPGLFALTLNSKAYALAFHQDGSLVTEASPAKAGEALTLYGTGFGPTIPARPEGLPVPVSPSFVVTDSASVQVGTADFAAQSAYALPGAVGIDVVEFTLGSGVPSGGDSQLTVTINKVVSNTVLLPVQ